MKNIIHAHDQPMCASTGLERQRVRTDRCQINGYASGAPAQVHNCLSPAADKRKMKYIMRTTPKYKYTHIPMDIPMKCMQTYEKQSTDKTAQDVEWLFDLPASGQEIRA